MDSKTTKAAHAAGLSEEDRRLILAMPERHGALTLAADWDAMNEDYAEDVLVDDAGIPGHAGQGGAPSLSGWLPGGFGF